MSRPVPDSIVKLGKELFDENGPAEEWLCHKCNWERRSRPSILMDYGDPRKTIKWVKDETMKRNLEMNNKDQVLTEITNVLNDYEDAETVEMSKSVLEKWESRLRMGDPEERAKINKTEFSLLLAALPIPDDQGVRFGPSLWLSWDKLAGYKGSDDEKEKQEFYRRDTFAEGLMEWRKLLLAAHLVLEPIDSVEDRMDDAERITKPLG